MLKALIKKQESVSIICQEWRENVSGQNEQLILMWVSVYSLIFKELSLGNEVASVNNKNSQGKVSKMCFM